MAAERNTREAAPGLRQSRRRAKGEATRDVLLRAAIDLASRNGIEGLTIGDLAKAAGMSKGGIQGRFGSKLELQRATAESAGNAMERVVFAPARAVEPGLKRLMALCENFMSCNERADFSAGRFIDKAAAETGAKAGTLRDQIRNLYGAVGFQIADCAREAQGLGQLDAGADPQQLAFELAAFMRAAACLFRLDDDPAHFMRARFAITRCLRPLVTAKSPPLPDVRPPKRRERVAAAMRH